MINPVVFTEWENYLEFANQVTLTTSGIVMLHHSGGSRISRGGRRRRRGASRFDVVTSWKISM